jgi:hypothetical protein
MPCIYYANFQSFLRYGIILWVGDNESIKIFELQRRILRLMSSVNNHTSCREIFKDYRILTVACSYLLEIICHIKKTQKISGTKCTNSQIRNVKKIGSTCSILQYRYFQENCSK